MQLWSPFGTRPESNSWTLSLSILKKITHMSISHWKENNTFYQTNNKSKNTNP